MANVCLFYSTLFHRPDAKLCETTAGGSPAAVLLGKMGAVLSHGRPASSPKLFHCRSLLGRGLLNQIQKLLPPAYTLHHNRHQLGRQKRALHQASSDVTIQVTPNLAILTHAVTLLQIDPKPCCISSKHGGLALCCSSSLLQGF